MQTLFSNNSFNSKEFNPAIADNFIICLNSKTNNGTIISMGPNKKPVFSQTLTNGYLFNSLNSAQQYINEYNIIDVSPVKVSDVISIVYYIKEEIINQLPVVLAKKIWMDSDAHLGRNMYSDLTAAQNSLNSVKQSVIEFYHKNMITATMTEFN